MKRCRKKTNLISKQKKTCVFVIYQTAVKKQIHNTKYSQNYIWFLFFVGILKETYSDKGFKNVFYSQKKKNKKKTHFVDLQLLVEFVFLQLLSKQKNMRICYIPASFPLPFLNYAFVFLLLLSHLRNEQIHVKKKKKKQTPQLQKQKKKKKKKIEFNLKKKKKKEKTLYKNTQKIQTKNTPISKKYINIFTKYFHHTSHKYSPKHTNKTRDPL